MQEAEVYLPIVSQKYTIDLSRTRSHFLPGYPLDVVVSVNTEVHTSGAGWTLKSVALGSCRPFCASLMAPQQPEFP